MHLIACQTVWEELQAFLPEGMSCQDVDMGLHIHPDKLRIELQRLIDKVSPERDTILLGFGLCSNAVVGLKSDHQRLVIPRVHDLGTYYLTKGFIEWRNDDPNNVLSYERLDEKYGRKKADRILGMMLKNYTRLALINTGNYGLENYRKVAKEAAGRLNLRFEEIQGANDLIRKLVQGPWDEEIIIFPPGETVTEDPFYKA